MSVRHNRDLAESYVIERALGSNAQEGALASYLSRPLLVGMTLILLVTAAGLALALQGWRSSILAIDMLTYFHSTYDLVTKGVLPRYGDISSYASFSPPGTSWLMAPGMVLVVDPRLYEKVGGAALYFGTLVGIFLLARIYFGAWCAYLSVLLYGLSGLGLAFAGSLWPIGHPFFYVWMVYFASRWVMDRNATYLAAAIGVWAAGMYVDMALTPAVLIVPVIWFCYRPPIRLGPLVAVGALAVALWFPYLQFESARGFADLRSQLLRQSMFPANYQASWCDPGLVLRHWDDPANIPVAKPPPVRPSQNRSGDLLRAVLTRIKVAIDGLLSNFETGVPLPGVSLALLLLALGALVAMSVSGLSLRGLREGGTARVLALSLVAPWLLLLLVAEPDRSERFLWLWPLQVVVLASFFTHLLPRLRAPWPVTWVGQLALIVVLIGSPLLSRVDSWSRTGWSGSDAIEIQVADYIAEQIRSEGHDHAAIGYHIFIYPFMASYNIINPQYKVGAEFDLWFKYRHGIANTDGCAEGLSPDDEYRIVQTQPTSGSDAPREYFAVPLDGRFRLLRQFGPYQVFRHQL